MVSATNVDATAVNTVGWLSSPETSIVVPVYQRQYRWDIGGCEQLLADIRAVADSDDRQMHFIGSILSAVNTEDPSGELVLIDGQQRITTLMLLAAALHHTVRATLPEMAAEVERVLVRAADPSRTKLRPHRAWAAAFRAVVLDAHSDDDARDTRFDDNYSFFRSQVSLEEAPRIWRGLQKLEHVSITLGAGANAQQIFESLNSTGEPLRDHELIHNYVLMGLSHDEQTEIEDGFWVPIEQNTGDAIAAFWRHYLVMRTGREVATVGERGVYDAFRAEFPRLDLAQLRSDAAEWKAYSEIYRVLLDPAHESDRDIARQIGFLNTFGRGMYPLVMRAYGDYLTDAAQKPQLVRTLEYVQALQLRRTVVGLTNERLVARLCRSRSIGQDELERAISRITPSDERVRVGLKYSELPHAAYVLHRLAGIDAPAGASDLELEWIFPPAPSQAWSGDGSREWSQYTEDEQNSHRALAKTLGNLTLLEEGLAERAADRSFPEKRDTVYPRSAVNLSTELASVPAWNTAAISARSSALGESFIEIWAKPPVVAIDDDGLTPILDAKRRRGWPRGWQREWDYVEYCGEHWEVYDVKYLFNRVFKRLWADSRESVVAFSARRGGPVYGAQSWNGQWDALDDAHFLYMGWDSRYMLTALQGVLDEAGLASEVFVKYSYTGNAMP
ncbi:DUF262 domain-containing protein [Microbacterium sp. P07]|uniref:DUF262 domain-containing protein n=1 Tax=Microbacterium sp. P07 TaxID=3366952 RepID=UPI0037462EF1